MDDKVVELAGYVICFPGISIPGAISSVPMGSRVDSLLILDILDVKEVPACGSTMPFLEVDLATPLVPRLGTARLGRDLAATTTIGATATASSLRATAVPRVAIAGVPAATTTGRQVGKRL
jgi:hypothetical protein